MNQEKIGKFIAENRKKINLTQEELAEKLGVSKNAVSKWERGICLMDMSLLKPLSEILKVTVNDILAGEKLDKDNYSKKSEENIINTIKYSNKEKNKIICMVLIIFGLIISIMSLTIFPSDSSWGSIYSVIGLMISLIGVNKINKKFNYLKRLIINIIYFIICLALFIFIDFISVILIKQVPRFSYSKEYYGDISIYRAPFYNVFRINTDTVNEYYIVDLEYKYNKDNVPISPFNREKSGIDNLIKYKSDSLSDNIKLLNMIDDLPLSEYEHNVIINKDGHEITIEYIFSNIEFLKDSYLEKALVYNTFSLFLLNSDLDSINYKFGSNVWSIEFSNINFEYFEFKITKKELKKVFPIFNIIYGKKINKDLFNGNIESAVNNSNYASSLYLGLFVENKLLKTNYIEVYNCDNELIKTIYDKNDIENIINIIINGNKMAYDAPVNLMSNAWTIIFYNENKKSLEKFDIWIDGWFKNGVFGYTLNNGDTNNLKEILEK